MKNIHSTLANQIADIFLKITKHFNSECKYKLTAKSNPNLP